MKPKQVAMAVAVALALLAGVYFVVDWTGTTANAHALRPGDAKLLAVGERVYGAHCAACHGARLEGQPNWQSPGSGGVLPAPPHDASGHTWHHADELLFRITKFGVAKAVNLADHKSTMPIYEGVLSDEEIVAVLSWIKSRWPPSIRDKHDQLNAASLSRSDR